MHRNVYAAAAAALTLALLSGCAPYYYDDDYYGYNRDYYDGGYTGPYVRTPYGYRPDFRRPSSVVGRNRYFYDRYYGRY